MCSPQDRLILQAANQQASSTTGITVCTILHGVMYAWCHCKLPSHIVMKQCGYLHRGHLCCLGLYPRQDTAERQPCRAVGTPRRHDDGAPSPRPAGHPLHYCDTHSKSLSTLRIELSPRGVPQCLHVSGFLLYLRATYPAPLSEILRYLPRGLSPTDQ